MTTQAKTQTPVRPQAPPQTAQAQAQAWEAAASGLTTMSADDLMNAPTRECILIAGGDKVGKTTSLISLCRFINSEQPSARIFVIDTENGWKKGLQTPMFRGKVKNFTYYLASNIEQVLEALDRIRFGTLKDNDVPAHLRHGPVKDGDWILVESMESAWSMAQDLGFSRVTGKKKSEYLGRDPVSGKRLTNVITPQPDMLWNVVKNAHDTRFVEVLTLNLTGVNVVMTTKKAKPRAEGGFMRENKDRAAFKAEAGIDAGFEGAPRLPYAPDTVLYFEKENNLVTCMVLGDRGSMSVGAKLPLIAPWEWPYRFFWWYRRGMTDEEYDAERGVLLEEAGA